LHLCVGHQHHAYELGHLARLKLFCYALKNERQQVQVHITRIEIIF
jgi:predicted glycosyltransferase